MVKSNVEYSEMIKRITTIIKSGPSNDQINAEPFVKKRLKGCSQALFSIDSTAKLYKLGYHV